VLSKPEFPWTFAVLDTSPLANDPSLVGSIVSVLDTEPLVDSKDPALVGSTVPLDDVKP